MSARNVSKESFQPSHTVIPRPPYSLNLLFVSKKQRALMCCHVLNSAVRLMPCVLMWYSLSFRRQPQLFVYPVRSFVPETIVSFPHSQWHNQNAFLFSVRLNERTFSRPNVCPEMSIRDDPISSDPGIWYRRGATGARK